ncbi:MAG: hypothetical protein U0235_26545 [Polyangiaceae bacterium]
MVLARIVRDEAAHGTFGFTFLDWAVDKMSEAELAHGTPRRHGHHLHQTAVGQCSRRAEERCPTPRATRSAGWRPVPISISRVGPADRQGRASAPRANDPIKAWTEADEANLTLA